jgi:hypothetical protein
MTVKNACNTRVSAARTQVGTAMASNSSPSYGETEAFERGMRAFACASQQPNLYRALLKGGEIAVQVSDGFDAAKIIF